MAPLPPTFGAPRQSRVAPLIPASSARVALVDGGREDGDADEADRAGEPEGKTGRDLPEDTTDEGRRRHGEAPDEVVEADGAGAERWPHEIDGHRLAGRLADLAQASHAAAAEQRHDTRRQHHAHRA